MNFYFIFKVRVLKTATTRDSTSSQEDDLINISVAKYYDIITVLARKPYILFLCCRVGSLSIQVSWNHFIELEE
jgi:hypothetical protein